MATFKEDLLDRIQRREQELQRNPQDEINKGVLERLKAELSLLERKEFHKKLAEDNPEVYRFITSGVNINSK